MAKKCVLLIINQPINQSSKRPLSHSKMSYRTVPPLLDLVELERRPRRVLLGLLESVSRVLESLADIAEPLLRLQGGQRRKTATPASQSAKPAKPAEHHTQCLKHQTSHKTQHKTQQNIIYNAPNIKHRTKHMHTKTGEPQRITRIDPQQPKPLQTAIHSSCQTNAKKAIFAPCSVDTSTRTVRRCIFLSFVGENKPSQHIYNPP